MMQLCCDVDEDSGKSLRESDCIWGRCPISAFLSREVPLYYAWSCRHRARLGPYVSAPVHICSSFQCKKRYWSGEKMMPFLGRLFWVDLIKWVSNVHIRPSIRSSQWVTQCDPIRCQGQGQEPLKVGNPSIFKGYLLLHLLW